MIEIPFTGDCVLPCYGGDELVSTEFVPGALTLPPGIQIPTETLIIGPRYRVTFDSIVPPRLRAHFPRLP